MSGAPSYQNHQVRFRDQTDSHRQNLHTEQVFYDLTELFNLANEQGRDITQMREYFEVNHYFSNRYLEQMSAQFQELRELVDGLQSAGNTYMKTIFASMMRMDETIPEWERAVVDPLHNIVTLPPSGHSSSKLYLYDEQNKEYIVPNTLQYTLTPAADGHLIRENDFMNALTPDDFKFWHRTYTYTTNVTEAKCEIVIKLPDNIISSRDVNTIYLHPFPIRTVDILNVEYRLGGGWKVIPGFKPVNNAGNLKFCFSPMGMSEIRVTLRQRNFIEKGGKNIFHMGLQDIGVDYNDYQSGIGRFEIPIAFNEKFTKKEILSIKPVFQNEETLSVHQANTRLLTFKVYEVRENGELRYLNDTFPIQVKENRVLLKGIMSLDRNTRSTPALTSVEITYKGDA